MLDPLVVAAPAAGALLASLPAWAWAAAGRVALVAGLAAALAVALLLGGGVAWSRGWPTLPPANVHQWPVWLAAAAALLSLAARLPWRWFAAAAALYAFPAAWVVLTLPRRSWSEAEGWAWTLLLAASWWGLLLVGRLTAERLPLPAAAAWTGALLVAAPFTLLAGSASTAQHLVAAVFAALVIAGSAWRSPAFPSAPAAVALAALAPAWLWLAHGSAERLAAPAVALASLAPLAAWAVWPWRARPALAAPGAVAGAAAVAAAGWWFIPALPAPAGW